MASIPQAIRNTFQRIRLKKVTLFAMFVPVGRGGLPTPVAVTQVSLAKATQIDLDIDPRNVAGAQIKMFRFSFSTSGNGDGGEGVADVMRIARMYPPIEVDTVNTTGGAPSTGDNYLSTAADGAQWTCFTYDIAGLTEAAQNVDMTYYFQAELLCNTFKA